VSGANKVYVNRKDLLRQEINCSSPIILGYYRYNKRETEKLNEQTACLHSVSTTTSVQACGSEGERLAKVGNKLLPNVLFWILKEF
jgi:hypothetical protein